MDADQELGSYRKLAVKQYPPRSLRETAEGAYWKRFRAPVLSQQVGCGPRVTAVGGARAGADRTCAAGRRCHARRLLPGLAAPLRLVQRHQGAGPAAGRRAVAQALTAPGAQVLVYDGATRQPQAQLSRFKDKAYGARFRPDGKLIVAGGETGTVQASGGSPAALQAALRGG